MIFTGPSLGPFADLISLAKDSISWTKSQLERHPYMIQYKHLIPLLTKLYDNLDSIYGHSEDESEIVLCHFDLHSGNIMIDPSTLEITGVLDWERASSYPWRYHWGLFRGFWVGSSDADELQTFMDNEL